MSSTHPPKAVLQRFARGEATRPEGREVVAHLLQRCERCAETVRHEAWLLSLPEDLHLLAGGKFVRGDAACPVPPEERSPKRESA